MIQSCLSVDAKHTDSREQTADWLGVCRADDLVLANDTTTNTLDHADLSSTLIVKLP